MGVSAERSLSTGAMLAGQVSEINTAAEANPLGDVVTTALASTSFEPTATSLPAEDCIPAWQRSLAIETRSSHIALLERRAVSRAAELLGRTCVVFNDVGRIVAGSPGWAQGFLNNPLVSAKDTIFAPKSPQSSQEFLAATKLLFGNCTISSVPLALRDLDGWVTEVIQIKRVGPANPTFAFTLLPINKIESAASIVQVATFLGLTAFEMKLVGQILDGYGEREMAANLKRKPSDIKRGLVQVTTKFRVRQKSDIIKLVASFS
jgi:hypothetical protein